MTALGIVLARNRGLMAMAISFNLVLIPRLNGIGAWFVWASGLVFALVLTKMFAASTSKGRHTPLEKYGGFYKAITGLMFVLGALFSGAPKMRSWLYKNPLLDPNAAINVHAITPYTVVAFLAAGITTWLLWCWAKSVWRIASAVFVAEITAVWTVFSRIPVPLNESHIERAVLAGHS
jgi:hypothetical protein